MALQDGDVVRFDYTLWVEGKEKPLDTSIEAHAKELGIHRDGKRYRPITVTLGASHIIPGLESHIRSHGKAGKPIKVELDAKDAYGERDVKKIRDIPMAQFRQSKVQPEVGMEVNLQNSRGVVTRVAGGRVRVDMNHDLAGKKLRYEYTIRDIVTDEQAKVDAVLESLFPAAGFKAKVGKDEVVLDLPDAVKFDQNWMMAKFRMVADVRLVTGKSKPIKLVETFPVIPDEEPGHEGHGHGPGEHQH